MSNLVQSHDRTARWDKLNNCWDIGDRTKYHWTDSKNKKISDEYEDLNDALNFIKEYDERQRTN